MTDITEMGPRLLTAHDLELYAVNTGEYYQLHKALAATDAPVAVWLSHLFFTVLPRYRREIEPVSVMPEVVEEVAHAMMAYYKQHVLEEKQCASG